MELGVITGAEDGGADPDHGAAAPDGIGEIIGHTHRHTFYHNIIVFFCSYVNRNIAHFFEKFAVISVFLTNWGDCHQTFYTNVRVLPNIFQQRQDFLRGKAALAFFAADVDLQQNILADPLAGGLLVDGGVLLSCSYSYYLYNCRLYLLKI